MKKLPKVSQVTLVTTLPVSGKRVTFRPFVVKEKKALLLAQESKNEEVILETLVDVIESCANNEIDARNIPLADLAYFFLQLRIASSGSDISFKTQCSNCSTDISINFNLEQVGVSKGVDPKIIFENGVGVIMRHATMEDTLKFSKESNKSIAVIRELIDTIFDQDTVYDLSEYTDEDLDEWIGELGDKELEAIANFIEKTPDIQHTFEYDCPSCKHHHSRELRGLQNFFRFSST